VLAAVRGVPFPSAAAFENGAKPSPGGFAVANSARKMPARKTRRTVKTRKLEKADCDLDFLFMVAVLVFGQR
jgi:hypothetical protein